MPNHTDNRVTIYHDDADMMDYIENILKSEDTELCHTLIPEERDHAGEPAEGWYEWRCQNWGTKWDIYEVGYDRLDSNAMHFTFSSAWSPPIPVFEHMAAMGFEVDARYLDEGWDFIGQFTADENGVTEDFWIDRIDEVWQYRPELGEEFDLETRLQGEEE